jgi:hypothetical protein
MNIFKKKSLCAAVAAGLGAIGAAGTAGAVNLSTDGTGGVLIYPYYSVRNGFETYLSVVNTTVWTKAVKVRFLEGMNSAEVLDFNLYLSPFDVWTGAVTATDVGARLITGDNSCTTPIIGAARGGIDANFVNYYYTGQVAGVPNRDAGPQGLDRTREGYIEVIDMGNIVTAATGGSGTSVVAAVKHNSAGVPANCGALQSNTFILVNGTDIVSPLTSPLGGATVDGLAGAGYLVNSNAGLEFGYDPVVLQNFSNVARWFTPGDVQPNLTQVAPADSYVFRGAGGVGAVATNTAWVSAIDAVSSLFMAANIVNEYVLEPTTLSQTDWVITMPTKRQYVIATSGATLLSAVAPFQRPFTAAAFGGVAGSSCDDFTMTYFNREEGAPTSAPGTINFSPLPSSTPQSAALCYETNVLSFVPGTAAAGQTSNLLGSTLRTAFTLANGFTNGWASLNFTDPTTVAPIVTRELVGNANSFHGLPAIGFMLQTFTRNGLVINGTPSTSGYGGNFNHKYVRRIAP